VLTTQSPTIHGTSLIQANVPLADKNWFRTGGNARWYCEPTTTVEFQTALTFAQDNGLEIFVLGQGANVLISDEGFDGLVIRPRLQKLMILPMQKNTEKVFLHAGAGATINDVIEFCLDNHILGLEEFSGIPGTIGGAVFINLHYFQFLLDHFLVEAEIVNKNTGEVKVVSKDWFNFGYNQSSLHTKSYYLTHATFALTQGTDTEIAYAKGRRTEIMRHRVQRYPQTYTCGSFFRNFHEHEVTLVSNGKKMIYVAYYLDKIGIKGELVVGDATVSYQHANMIVNRGNATSTDIINIAHTMQQLVYDQFGIVPQPECQLIGFKLWPLHT